VGEKGVWERKGDRREWGRMKSEEEKEEKKGE
jgi:hypothetical protein